MDKVDSHDKDLEKRMEYPYGTSVTNYYTFEPEWDYDEEEVKIEYIAYDLKYEKNGVYGNLGIRISKWDEEDQEYKLLFSKNLEGKLLIDHLYATHKEKEFRREIADIFSLEYQNMLSEENEGIMLPNTPFHDPLENLLRDLRGYYERYTNLE